MLFGVKRPLGQLFLDVFGIKIVFSWAATVIAAVVISFPLMYRAARGAFEQVDVTLIDAARTLGFSERRIFWQVIMAVGDARRPRRGDPGVCQGARRVRRHGDAGRQYRGGYTDASAGDLLACGGGQDVEGV